MTAFTTRCCASTARGLRAGLFVLFTVFMLAGLSPSPARAEASARSAGLAAVEEGYVLNADFRFDLNSRLVDAVRRGVALYFTVDFIVEQPRRFWLDRVVVERRRQYRLSYHPITRSYRLSLGSLHRSFDSLEPALRTMTRIRNWQVMEYEDLSPGIEYRASLRMRHEVDMLPRPLLVTASGGREWSLVTPWLRWNFEAEAER